MNQKELKIFDDVFKFTLNTAFCIPALVRWLEPGLNALYPDCFKKYGKDEDAYDELMLGSLDFKVLFKRDGNECIMITNKQKWNINNNDDYRDFIVNVFKIINEATKDYPVDNDFERFFIKKVELIRTLKLLHEDVFRYLPMDNPLAVEYPAMQFNELTQSMPLDTEFLANSKLTVKYKKGYDKLENDTHSYIDAIYSGETPDKRFPVKEQLYLVEDVTKELLARAATFKTELEMKINDK